MKVIARKVHVRLSVCHIQVGEPKEKNTGESTSDLYYSGSTERCCSQDVSLRREEELASKIRRIGRCIHSDLLVQATKTSTSVVLSILIA
ncbi:hypothetical protein TNIN_228081 [Trichonephila inaurata madagascariensis]|uniref:Uncharacterized protein n=1 Tax=Trichonephila inaurata madagascariensis TaxID=2747483 RepID=A0A8X6K984_9ARAC|nr:hypothetical protein TNIN_228081 [Trichonephila inaurata madagascariensis]